MLTFIRKFSVLAVAFAVGISSFGQDAHAAPAAKKEWTLLVFLNGFNNLDPFGTLDIKEMEQIGSTAKINVVVQWASLKTKSVRRLFIQKSSDPTKVISPVVQDLGRIDMGDYHNLVDFVKWGAENYPANHYFVDVWNHGSGWHRGPRGLSSSRVNRSGNLAINDISFDDLSGNSITTHQLGVAMKEISTAIGQKIDIYGSDACLMGMAEIASEMKDSVSVYIGSQELEPGPGWNYEMLLKEWDSLAKATPIAVSQVHAKAYKASYATGYQTDVTMAAYDMSRYDALATAVKGLGSAIRGLDAAGTARVQKAVAKAQGFYLEDYKDIGDFVKKISADNADGYFPTQPLKDLEAAVKNFVVANETHALYAKATGVSFWIPGDMDYALYSSTYTWLKFNQETDWLETIKQIKASSEN